MLAVVIALIGTAAQARKQQASERDQETRVLVVDASQEVLERAARDVAGSNPASAASRSETCSDARHGLKWYRSKVAEYRARMGARPEITSGRTGASPRPCPQIRRAAKYWRGKAIEWRKKYEAYQDEWNWRAWLPAKWVRIGTCETGLRWDWNSGTYQGAFGFWYGTWDAYKPRGAPSEAYLATPRQQYEAALNVYAAHGYGAWGCGGA